MQILLCLHVHLRVVCQTYFLLWTKVEKKFILFPRETEIIIVVAEGWG